MAKIRTYPDDDKISLDDRVIGSDADNPNKPTKNYRVGDLALLLSDFFNGDGLVYTYKDSSLDEQGLMHSDDVIVRNTTELYLHAFTKNGVHVEQLFDVLKTDGSAKYFKVTNTLDPSKIAFYEIISITRSPGDAFYKFNVSLINTLGYGLWEENSDYYFSLNVSGGASGIPHHNATLNKQGGDTLSNEYYHLTEAERDSLISLINNVAHPDYFMPTVNINLSDLILEEGSNNVRIIKSLFTKNDAGNLIAHRIYKNSNIVSQTDTYNETGVVPSGQTKYYSQADYGQGDVKDNEIGIPDAFGRIEAGTIQSDDVLITGITPWFWKTFNVLPNLNNLNLASFNKEVGNSNGTVRANLNVLNEFIIFVIPNASQIKTKWYVTDLSRGDIGSNNFILSPVVKTLDSPQSFWSNEIFKIYVSAYISDIQPIIELRNN